MDPNEDLRRFRVAQRELAAEEVAIRQQVYATSSSRRVLGLIQQSNAVHRGMRPEEENVQLVQRFYHLAPPPLVFVGEYAKPVLDANAMSSMAHASAFNTDAIYRGFGNPTQEAEIALHEGVAAKYKARKIPAITPFTGSIFEAKPLDDPSPEEKKLKAQEQAAADNDDLLGPGAGAGPGAGPSAGTNAGAGAGGGADAGPGMTGSTPLSAFSPGGAAGHLSTGDSLNLSLSPETAKSDAGLNGQRLNFASPSPTGLNAEAVAEGTGGQANLTAETGGSTLAAAQPEDASEPPPPEVDSPNKIALKRTEAAKQAAEENARKAIDDAKIAKEAADAAAEEAAKTFLGLKSPKNMRAQKMARKAQQKAEEEQAKLKKLQLEQERLRAAVEVERDRAAGVRTRNTQAAAAAAVEASRAPAPAPGASSNAAAAPAVPALPPKYGQPLRGVKKGSLSRKATLTTRFVQYVGDVAKQGVVAVPAAISSVVGAIASYAAEQYKSATTEPEKKAVLDGATAGFALARKTAEQDGLDLNPFEEVIHNAATQALGGGASSALINGMEAAVNRSKTSTSPPVPANLPPIFSPPPRPSAAAAAAAEPPATAAAEPSAAAAAAAEPPAAAAAAAKPSAAAAAAAPPAAAAAAVAADDVRSAVTEEYNKIEDSKFNMALPIVTLEAALIPTLTKLANAVGMTQAEVKQDAKYLANSVLLFQAKERRSIILSMIVRSMNVPTSKLIGPGKLPASHQRPQRAHLAVADKVGPRSGVMGGFGKPASAKRPRFEKGSQEARDFMAQLRAKRQKK